MIFAIFSTAVAILFSYIVLQHYAENASKLDKGDNNKLNILAPGIVPVNNEFRWENQKPFPYRPFKKGSYKMTLAIRKLDPNDMFCIEDTYLDRVNLRKKIFQNEKLYGFHESAIESLKEAYTYIFLFLMRRYPMYFVLSTDSTTIDNKITGESFPLDPTNLKPNQIMYNIVSNIEEDILILIKNPETSEMDEYVLRAAISLFPAGFNPLEKMNNPLTKIHEPVPGYVNKLQLSMNKFFSRLNTHEYIVRNNWSIQTHCNLCAPSGSHATEEEATVIHPFYPEELDYNKVFFRVEKQCFTRLAKTGSNLMVIRTYVTSLMELRDSLNDEEKETLCSAIDGLTGELAIYKRRIQWGDAAKAFIRGESNGINTTAKKYLFVS